ncbi:MAG: hypothetical protein JNL79_06455 [Myxococcales bacterium]|nr:hypothetical protein [Myxococcales bacterium]
MRMRVALSGLLFLGCGGRVIDTTPDAAEDAAKVVADAGLAPESAPLDRDTGTPVVSDAEAKPADATPPVTPSCSDGPASGPPKGCGSATGCAVTDSLEFAKAQIACYVDRCAIEATGKPWCGTLKLGLDASGCTSDYGESGPGLGGCVKYQGFYRSWPCAAGKVITITRPCT